MNRDDRIPYDPLIDHYTQLPADLDETDTGLWFTDNVIKYTWDGHTYITTTQETPISWHACGFFKPSAAGIVPPVPVADRPAPPGFPSSGPVERAGHPNPDEAFKELVKLTEEMGLYE